MTDVAHTFDDPDDARTFLREVGLLWAVWVAGLAAVLLTHGRALVLVALVLLGALLFLARPLLPRSEALVPENSREGGALETAFRGGTTRDRVLRDLAYGVAPMQAALETAGLSSRWLVLRHLVVALTLLAFAYVVVVPLL